MVVTRMSAKEARDRFSGVLNRAYYQRESIIVERQGKPVAVVLSVADFERYQQLAREQFFGAVDRIQARNAAHDPDEVLRDVTEAVDEVRQETYTPERNSHSTQCRAAQ